MGALGCEKEWDEMSLFEKVEVLAAERWDADTSSWGGRALI
jgi:hypothetical protein